ncbi:4-(cytidine 5'-diphospho)-2-C-methyl-D-erythritol kinase [Acetobacter vaccinii]|uniref:4-diphosphocytidyl-2-C-methyl-D-erythritol kinase n=1 Tax=Acetobacter vaccinii TaxID=2592655 RepID=A0A5C1YPY1_9PROT|nr:4-(cytidine 5'-diphospho)-2-C-methyl-D-erythritol kinase [Acetobacter vaccinii]QEO17598.1 4-(cytidine 5'-diphospho)-2-C-methyl-D-erythritol kinase [Acetobacter vaccinii]
MTQAFSTTSDNTLVEAAPAKINLYLHVTGRREDGYHLLDSLVVFAQAGDVLRYVPGPEPLHLKLTGRFGETLGESAAGPDNLVMKAAAALATVGDGTGVQGGCLVLEKNLPVASGIGGGSADAAAALRLLDRAWGINAGQQTLLTLAERLGADVPVCVLGHAIRMEGIGEVLSPVPALPECGMVLVNCGQAVSTPEVFRRRQGAFANRATIPAGWPDVQALIAFLQEQTNSLEDPACDVCPVVSKVLADIAGQDDCLLSRMSGSGATCFGLFPTAESARQAAERLADAHDAWWVWGGGLK